MSPKDLPRKAPPSAGPEASPADVAALVARDLADPHRLLGAHPTKDGAVVRVWRPDAYGVVVHPESGDPVEAERIDDAGLFQVEVPGAEVPLRYGLEVDYGQHGTFPVDDPYRHAPTVGDLDLHLMGEGRHEALWERLGAHVRELDGVRGTSFAVWAPNARSVSVVGEFNGWDGRLHPMRTLGASGVWELFVPGVGDGQPYKYELRTQDGTLKLNADPFAFQTLVPPETDSVVHETAHVWQDDDWVARRNATDHLAAPMSVYEVHLPSWRRGDGDALLSYAELGEQLGDYAVEMGFTHVELLPVMGHPFPGSWGYQVTSYFAPTPRHGSPDDFRAFVDALHARGVGVLLDWVPAHFPRDSWALAQFDGTALYEHADPRRGSHPDWGTLIFNFGRNEVRNFLLASALFWVDEFHVDGLRVDAVASMLYLDYSREEGQWVPNEHGGREDLEAVAFLKEMNEVVYAREPGTITAAEESTSWPGVSRPTYTGGLGFGFKWNMGWMHDTLEYFQQDPINRRYHHHSLTFALHYAFSENFVLPLSHDEVVHGKGSLIEKMPGDRWQQLANLRALYGFMWAHPGKNLLFMGQEFAQEREWSHERSLDWHLLDEQHDDTTPPTHSGVQSVVRDLNHVMAEHPALWQRDNDADGFWWLEPNDAENNVVAFARAGAVEPSDPATLESRDLVICVANLSPVPREGYRVGLPRGGPWRVAVNTDAAGYGGSDAGSAGRVDPDDVPWHGQPCSAELALPPLGVLWLVPDAGAA
ncbi:1,4-alpha-glucan branching protein GlgB [Patulibacter minatonensis]|uniref:1,4-alpha-glucan branching protein GlgB n=1 Tax=Patulibacter minatonensis TaxID=298163 RepID=UPI00047CF3AE|nr:1,4-alpha-glucan branching protein GlgB [Patulibacter minatonensis]